MTVMPEHAARLLETNSLLVLDPISGPQAKPISNLALGDEILVQADGRMCFRRLISVSEAIAPGVITRLNVSALAINVPRAEISLDSRQPVGLPLAQAGLNSAKDFPSALSMQQNEQWLDVLVEGAERIVVDNLSVATGTLRDSAGSLEFPPKASIISPTSPDSAKQTQLAEGELSQKTEINSRAAIEPSVTLKAFTGQIELPLLAPVSAAPWMVLQFVLPARTTTLRLISASAQPAGDSRKLGVAILRLSLEDSEISLDSPALVRGFHRAETGEGLVWRWTDGEALLILQPKPIAQIFSVHITDWHKSLRAS